MLTQMPSANTDGADTIFSSHIKFNNWTVYNGDDSLSLKANSTDITITNSKFVNGLGIAFGSIGQLKDQYETIERVYVENIEYEDTLHAVSFLNRLRKVAELTRLFRYTSKHGQMTRMATHRMVEVEVWDVRYQDC